MGAADSRRSNPLTGLPEQTCHCFPHLPLPLPCQHLPCLVLEGPLWRKADLHNIPQIEIQQAVATSPWKFSPTPHPGFCSLFLRLFSQTVIFPDCLYKVKMAFLLQEAFLDGSQLQFPHPADVNLVYNPLCPGYICCSICPTGAPGHRRKYLCHLFPCTTDKIIPAP